MIKLIDILKEEVEGNKLYLYHRTKTGKAKQIAQNNFSLTPGHGRAGNGTYFVYDNPSEIKSGIDAYGGISLRYSIPLTSLNRFLIFDPELQTLPLEQQLSPITNELNNILNQRVIRLSQPNLYLPLRDELLLKIANNPLYRENILQGYIDLYNKGKLKQLSFIELIEMGESNILEDNYDGIIYSAKGDIAGGGMLITGTQKTAVIFNQSILTFEGVSTDGINYRRISNSEEETKSALKSPEFLLKRNQLPPNSVIKKSFIKLNGARNLQLPTGLKIIGSLDLRNIPDLVIPNDLEVTNSLYVSPGVIIPDDVKNRAKNIVDF
jgi:hypothetical protein